MQIPEGRPAVMGILNVTPDSFSDGGLFLEPAKAIDQGLAMIDDGADIIDVGGESTRPGADSVSAEEEIRRVATVVEALAKRGAVVSIDTSKAIVADTCLSVGAAIVNDVTAMADVHMAEVVFKHKATICLMHMQGSPRSMQVNPSYSNVVEEVLQFLIAKVKVAENLGIEPSKIWLDPGIGFGKAKQHNLELIQNIRRFVETGYTVLVGVSRKRFLGEILGEATQLRPVQDRLFGTIAIQNFCQLQGVKIFRVHDIKPARDTSEMYKYLNLT